VVGNSGKPAPEVGGEQVLWQGGGEVDRFEAKKRSEGGSPEVSMVVLAAAGEPAVEARTRGQGGRRLGRGAARSCIGAQGVRRGWGGTAWWFHNGAQWRSGGWRAEEGERVLYGGRAPSIAGRGGGRKAAWRQNRGGETAAGSRGRGKSAVAAV
jgi:hypothetical protein